MKHITLKFALALALTAGISVKPVLAAPDDPSAGATQGVESATIRAATLWSLQSPATLAKARTATAFIQSSANTKLLPSAGNPAAAVKEQPGDHPTVCMGVDPSYCGATFDDRAWAYTMPNGVVFCFLGADADTFRQCLNKHVASAVRLDPTKPKANQVYELSWAKTGEGKHTVTILGASGHDLSDELAGHPFTLSIPDDLATRVDVTFDGHALPLQLGASDTAATTLDDGTVIGLRRL
ncbi:hypothetical protein [Dyella sp. 20L07]|uniref:hypothetical protein n=1 Tax=Dyella sp. 20L07 TaxID=3384240 RepID=UPI003D2E55B2